MTNTLKQKFELYFADLKADARREGYTVSKRDEWARWVEKDKADRAAAAALEDFNYVGSRHHY